MVAKVSQFVGRLKWSRTVASYLAAVSLEVACHCRTLLLQMRNWAHVHVIWMCFDTYCRKVDVMCTKWHICGLQKHYDNILFWWLGCSKLFLLNNSCWRNYFQLFDSLSPKKFSTVKTACYWSTVQTPMSCFTKAELNWSICADLLLMCLPLFHV